MKIGIIGCGNIGRVVIRAVFEGVVDCEVVCVFDADRRGFEKLPKEVISCLLFTDKFDFFIMQDMDIVVEAASQEAVREFSAFVLGGGKDMMIMSVGALVDAGFRGQLVGLAKEKKVKIYIPSGAIAGIDGLKSAMSTGVGGVVLTTSKPPSSLGVDTKTKRIIYDGYAEEAVRLFPKNVNVSATLALAGVGFEKTRVKIIADPNLKENVHEVVVRGDFGTFSVRVENVPSPDNPKTSYLAALSAIATLKKITSPLQIGT